MSAHKKQTWFANRLANNLENTIPTIPTASFTVVNSDNESYYDESAIDDDDEDWEDSSEEDSSKKKVDIKTFPQRVDSNADLTSHRSLITLGLQSNQHRGPAPYLANIASQSTSATPQREIEIKMSDSASLLGAEEAAPRKGGSISQSPYTSRETDEPSRSSQLAEQFELLIRSGRNPSTPNHEQLKTFENQSPVVQQKAIQTHTANLQQHQSQQIGPNTPPEMSWLAHPDSRIYSFVPIPGEQQHKRPRRRYNEIERMYKCGWNGCEKSYGTLNHLNAHVTMQSHGQKRVPEGMLTSDPFQLRHLSLGAHARPYADRLAQ